MQLYSAHGYGVELDDISDFLKDEFSELSACELHEKIYDPRDTVSYFDGESNFLYIPTIMPFEQSLFEDFEEIDNYLYRAIKPILINDNQENKIKSLFDEVFDYTFL